MARLAVLALGLKVGTPAEIVIGADGGLEPLNAAFAQVVQRVSVGAETRAGACSSKDGKQQASWACQCGSIECGSGQYCVESAAGVGACVWNPPPDTAKVAFGIVNWPGFVNDQGLPFQLHVDNKWRYGWFCAVPDPSRCADCVSVSDDPTDNTAGRSNFMNTLAAPNCAMSGDDKHGYAVWEILVLPGTYHVSIEFPYADSELRYSKCAAGPARQSIQGASSASGYVWSFIVVLNDGIFDFWGHPDCPGVGSIVLQRLKDVADCTVTDGSEPSAQYPCACGGEFCAMNEVCESATRTCVHYACDPAEGITGCPEWSQQCRQGSCI